MKTVRYTLIIVLSFSISACGYIKGGVEELIDIPLLEQKTQGAEIISASIKGERTTNGYYVDTSAGSISNQIKTTTANGYQVYYGLQGELASDVQ